MTRTLSLALASAAAFAAASAASAASAAAPAQLEGDTFTVGIPVSDLDLSTENGRRDLAKRTRAAARKTCAPNPFPAQFDAWSFEQCRLAFHRAAADAVGRSGHGGQGATGAETR